MTRPNYSERSPNPNETSLLQTNLGEILSEPIRPLAQQLFAKRDEFVDRNIRVLIDLRVDSPHFQDTPRIRLLPTSLEEICDGMHIWDDLRRFLWLNGAFRGDWERVEGKLRVSIPMNGIDVSTAVLTDPESERSKRLVSKLDFTADIILLPGLLDYRSGRRAIRHVYNIGLLGAARKDNAARAIFIIDAGRRAGVGDDFASKLRQAVGACTPMSPVSGSEQDLSLRIRMQQPNWSKHVAKLPIVCLKVGTGVVQRFFSGCGRWEAAVGALLRHELHLVVEALSKPDRTSTTRILRDARLDDQVIADAMVCGLLDMSLDSEWKTGNRRANGELADIVDVTLAEGIDGLRTRHAPLPVPYRVWRYQSWFSELDDDV